MARLAASGSLRGDAFATELRDQIAMLEWKSRPGLVAAVRGAIGSTPARTIAGRIAEIARLDARSDLRAARCPVHWLTAARDRMVPGRATTLAQSERADLVVEVIDGPHLLAQTHPEEVARAIHRAVPHA